MKTKTKMIGFLSGIPELDSIIKGLYKGEITFIAENYWNLSRENSLFQFLISGVSKYLQVYIVDKECVSISILEQALQKNSEIKSVFISNLLKIDPLSKGDDYEIATLMPLRELAIKYGVSIVINEMVFASEYNDFHPSHLFNDANALDWVNCVIFVDNPSKYEVGESFKIEWIGKIQIKVFERSFGARDVKLPIENLLII